MAVQPQILLITREDRPPLLPPDHRLPSVSTVDPAQALGLVQELRARGVPTVAVIDASAVHVPALLTELAMRYRDVSVVVAASGQDGVPGGARGVWRAAQSPELVGAIHVAAQSAVQKARVRTTLDRINIRLRSPEPVDESQRHRLLLSRLYLSNILEQASDAIFVTDRQGGVAVWNGAAERLFNRPAADVVNRRIDAVGGSTGAALLALVESVSAAAKHRVEELTIDGTPPREVELSLSLIADHDGTGIAVSGIARDVTERNALNRQLQEQAEALAASNRHKEEFLAVLSHELRTPLNTVLGWARMLQQMPHDVAHVQRAADMIARNATVQWRLVTDLLEYARITAGQLGLHRTVADLGALTKSTLDGIRPEFEARRLSIEEHYDPSVVVSVDRDRLSQVILNLLTNAMKFTPEGGRVFITVARTGAEAELRVRDTGQGIEPDFLPHIFDAFRQGDTSTTRAGQGLGLGLAITRRIVELHGGRVHAESEGPGRGATFTVTIPAQSS